MRHIFGRVFIKAKQYAKIKPPYYLEFIGTVPKQNTLTCKQNTLTCKQIVKMVSMCDVQLTAIDDIFMNNLSNLSHMNYFYFKT